MPASDIDSPAVPIDHAQSAMTTDEVVARPLSTGGAVDDAAIVHRPSWTARSINRLANLTGLRFGDLDFDTIIANAERRARSSDWGSDNYLRQLRAAIGFAEADTRLTPVGRMAASIIYNWHTVNRLRVVEYVKRRPHVAEIEIAKPIFITGWYRTATTNLHNLLGLDPAHRAPWCWELCYPLPQHRDPARDRRRRRWRMALTWKFADLLGPDQKYAHELRADGPEECFFLLANSAFFVQQIMGWLGYRYARHLLETDQSEAYRDLRLQYQILADQRPGRQWIMKCPQHLWFLDDLIKAFPDARIIHTHRAAAKAIPSVCSLSAIMAQPFAADYEPIRHGRFFQDYCRIGMERAMRARQHIPSSQILDIRMLDLSRDPVGAVRSVYDRFDLPWHDEMPARIRSHVEREARHRTTLGRKHRYTAEQFGLDATALSRDFADYEREFLDPSAVHPEG